MRSVAEGGAVTIVCTGRERALVCVYERESEGVEKRGREERERERDKRLHSPFALHAPGGHLAGGDRICGRGAAQPIPDVRHLLRVRV